MKIIEEIENEIVEEFSWFNDPMERYEYLIEIGKKLPPLDAKFQTEENSVKGCQSKVWLHSEFNNGVVVFQADSNTVITKGIIGLLVRVLTHQTPKAIIQAPLTFIDKIDLRSHLSSQRSNGLNAMIQQMKWYAIAYQAQQKKKTLN